MMNWLIRHRYAISVVALILLLIFSLSLLATPQSCANPKHPAAGSLGAAPPATDAAPAGASPAVTPAAGTKNDAGDPGLAPPPPGGWHQAGGGLLVCGSNGNTDWSTTACAFQVICQCTLSMPQDGWVLISASGSLSGLDCEYEAQFRLGIDDTGGDPATDRWVDIYGDSGDGMDAAVAMSVLRPVRAGTHTFYFLGRRASGTGGVLLHDAALAVIASGG